MPRVADKVAIVTGGAHGIGLATCRILAREGAKVAVTDIDRAEGESQTDALVRDGATAGFWQLNVAEESQVERVFREVRDAFGPVTVLVNNAGIAGVDKPTHEIELEEWEQLMAVNVRGTFLCTKHAIPQMRAAGGGSIVNLSSIYGMISDANLPPYHASKGAVRLMAKTDALLYAADGIRVNSVHPAFIWTPLVEQMAQEDSEGPEAYRRRVGALHPIGKIGEPDDIAYGILYLASDEAKFVTGSELVIDGGYTAR